MQVDDETVRAQMARLTDDELRIALTTGADSYHPEALVLAAEELERRGLSVPTPTEAAALELQKAREIPVGWLKFYTYVRLPVEILFSLFPFFNDSGIGMALFILLTPLRGFVLVGLHRRTLWGWKLNWVYLATTVLLLAWTGPSLLSQALGIPFWALVWGFPNYFYFKRRRHLFH